MPVAEQADIGPDARQIVERRCRHRVVIAAGADAAAVGMRGIGCKVHRIIRDRGQRDGCGVFGRGDRAMRVTQDPRYDAVAHGCLIVAASPACSEVAAQGAQHRRFVLVAPQRFERLVIVLERRAKRFDRQGEGLDRELQPAARRDRRIGDQRRGAGRAVDERAAFLHFELEVSRQLGKQRIERHYFPRAALAGARRLAASARRRACARRLARCVGWWRSVLR